LPAQFLYTQSTDGQARSFVTGQTHFGAKREGVLETHAPIWEVVLDERSRPLRIQFDNDEPVLVPEKEVPPQKTSLPEVKVPTLMPAIDIPKVTVPLLPRVPVPLPKLNPSAKAPTVNGKRKGPLRPEAEAEPKKADKAKDDPGPNKPDPQTLARQRLALAKQLLQDGKKEQARKWFEQIVSDFPDTPAADEARRLLRDAGKK
jgi:hypothetical protein